MDEFEIRMRDTVQVVNSQNILDWKPSAVGFIFTIEEGSQINQEKINNFNLKNSKFAICDNNNTHCINYIKGDLKVIKRKQIIIDNYSIY